MFQYFINKKKNFSIKIYIYENAFDGVRKTF